MKRFSSVRFRVTLVATGLFAVALILASFGLVERVRNNLEDEIRKTNNEQLNAVAQQLQRGVDPNSVDVPNRPGGIPSIRIERRERGERDDDLNRGPNSPFATLPANDPRVRAQRRLTLASGTVTLVAERSLTEVTTTTDRINDSLTLGVPFLIVLMGLMTWWLTGRALRPVEQIRSEAAAITGSTIHKRVPEPTTNDEIGRLARTMNSMLDRLEESSQRQRSFVSDASHELRSPIATIRAQLEVAKRRGADADWPAVADRILAEDARLENAVTDLLDLARAEEGENIDAVVDIDEIVLTEADRYQSSEIVNTTIDTHKVSAGRARGNPAQCTRIVRNLLDNACRHAKSQVAVSLTTEQEFVVLTVDDDGPGIPLADRDRVFDRFTRLDEGRSRDAGGMGIGLAMVRTIADRHGGSVTIGDAPLGGARFVVRLPAEI
ncbi:MAG: HAMP domain-containing histidine kinase [Acidimicrobiia bacterium]|nr:HAMP domain-containing histidine kinase [Acidimicrobiia bacterium]